MSGHTKQNATSHFPTTTLEEELRYITRSEWTRSDRARDVAFTAMEGAVEGSYDNPLYAKDNELAMFSYVDWGGDSHAEDYYGTEDRLGGRNVNGRAYTADLVRDPTTESVYLDFVDNEYARELRQFPEEVLD